VKVKNPTEPRNNYEITQFNIVEVNLTQINTESTETSKKDVSVVT